MTTGTTTSLSMYEASVPVFGRYLQQLSAMLDLAQAHARKQGLDPNTLLQARLSPTMYPFSTQVEIAVGFVVRACAPLAGLPKPEDAPRPSKASMACVPASRG